jgi:glycogen debranching enzyme
LEDVIRVKDQFYVLATSPFADDRTRVLKYGDTFVVLNRFGDIGSAGLGEQGLYHGGTRYLSRFVLRLGGSTPQILRSTIQDDNAFLTVDLMNLDIYQGNLVSVPRGALHLFRSKFLWNDICYENIRLSNHSLHPIETSVSFEFGADFHDIFEVRGTRREKAGSLLAARVEDDIVILPYEGRDNKRRKTFLHFDPVPTSLTDREATFSFSLRQREEVSFSITVSCEEADRRSKTVPFDRALRDARTTLKHTSEKHCHITTSDRRFNSWLARSEADLQMMTLGNPEGDYPYAGVPWFNTVFGRDGIITAMECLWTAPAMSRSVLGFLAETQATQIDDDNEAEPGKILHEMRRGEMANLKEVPFGHYYGSVDATPLFVTLAGAYLDRSDDIAFIKTIWPNILAALDWIVKYGDADQDGFVEYRAKSSKGLVQQGWKDSHDSVFHRDGTLAEPPIALCEVQAYVFAAMRAAARIATRIGQSDLANKLSSQAERIQEQFERQFWDEDLNCYVLALDGQKKPCRVRTSNAGHCLYCGIVSPERSRKLANTLLCEGLFCGWGIRTLDSREIRYNPMSYHNGSIWPHDNALVARGLARYGFKREALSILSGMFEASTFMDLNRLPELFCGFHRRSPTEGPTLYPVACSPQAWAAGAVNLMLEASLGIEIRLKEKVVQLNSPFLPDSLDLVRLENLSVGEAEIDFVVRNNMGEVSVELIRTKGNIAVTVQR